MSTTLIIESITRHIQLSAEEKEHFISLLQPKVYKRKQFILEEGEICKYSTFVTKGCLRGFTVDQNGFEHVLNFAPVGWWIADMYSLLTQKPGILNIEALEETEVLLLSKSRQEKLYLDIPQFERFFRIITENSLVSYQQRLIDNLSLTAEERYNNFCRRYPTLINTLPKKQIAAYIGVTPEFFSRMQHQMLKGKK
ncbi:cAMP-binding domain of CRP or a regulatory subunit of cAMP-dependent protein kinases [Mucilaginibacter mallensis]|uniref:cAMP-binding domain of CRP or a regulatory subunit of cAMP-dependent protein kinases n=1 Tax=Mucilaginibacter mallensis TaxID=652787 RepID=A0A1H1WVQ3_MUCMA|nr:Crp/Fnr family transcriptional regulator [Mucilaginibacter mallensis]SDT01263.1 cAMP-binding domain of CRP or a regulatory subunit of cAMP-dependent protein kinases [Mucilaginibacter mallensis]